MESVLHVERLVDHARVGIGVHEHLHTLLNLLVVAAGKGTHDDTHGPGHVVAHVWAADTFAGLTPEEVGIVLAPYKAARVLVDGVVDVYIAQIGHGQQAGHIGIVHEQLVAEAVYLKGIDLAVLGMVVYGVFLQGFLHLVGQIGALLGQVCTLVDGGQYLGSLVECGHGHEVGRDEEEESSGIVGWTEDRGYQSHGFDRCSPAGIADSVELAVGDAQKLVRTGAIFALLLAEGL